MRILIISPYLSSVYGGPTKIVREIVQKLGELEIELDLITTNANGDRTLDVPLNTWNLETDYRVRYFSCFYKNDLIFSPSLALWLYQNIANYDLVHTHTIFSPLISLCHQICRIKSISYITTPHGMLESWTLSYKAWKKKPYYSLLEKRNLQQASAIQATATPEIKTIKNLGFKKSIIIPNGIHREEFQNLANPEIFYQKFPEAKNKTLILFLARIDPKKGLDLLAPAFAKANQQFPEAHLIIAGPDSIGYLPTVKNYFIQSGCINSVTFTGMLTGSLKSSVLAASNMYIAPSYSEGFSMSILEGMASGLPSIITTGCNFPEAALNKTARVVDINSDDIGEALIKLLKNPLASKAMGDRARDFILQNYTWDISASKLSEVYQKIVANQALFEQAA